MSRLFLISLVCSVLGIFALLLISFLVQPKEISSYSDLKENDYVKVSGKISSIRSYDDFSIIRLNNNITLTCNCKFPINSTISATGKVEIYQDTLQVNAEKIERIN